MTGGSEPIVVRCDDATVPKAWEGEHTLNVRQHGPAADLNARIETLFFEFYCRAPGRVEDLVRIASYVYAADQSVTRGGVADIELKSWQRTFHMCIAVHERGFWESTAAKSALCRTLQFVSDDFWDFAFSDALAHDYQPQMAFESGPASAGPRPNVVILFSGGADSLCATVRAVVRDGLRPALVSHWPTPPVNSRQVALLRALRARFPAWSFPHVGSWIHRKGSDASTTTQRTRSFLFACLGAGLASALGIDRILLPDNGVVSLNLPINAQLLGALASRSTHPRFISRFNELLSLVAGPTVSLENPLWADTRVDGLHDLRQANLESLLQDTVSCSHTRGRPAVSPHCGLCSQCVSRRFASVAAGMEEHDLAERYGFDIFKDELPVGTARVYAVSFVRSAVEIEQTKDEDLLLKFPELFEAILPDDPSPSKTAGRYAGLLRRHAESVLTVMESQIALAKKDLVRQTLSANCLISLVAAGRDEPNGRIVRDQLTVPAPGLGFSHSADYRTVTFHGETYALTPQQARLVQALDEDRVNGVRETSNTLLLGRLDMTNRRLGDLFKSVNRELWGRDGLVGPGTRKGMYRLNLQ